MNFLASLFGNENQTKMTTSEERQENERKMRVAETERMRVDSGNKFTMYGTDSKSEYENNATQSNITKSYNPTSVRKVNLTPSVRPRSASEERVIAEKAARMAALPENNKLSDSVSNVDITKGQLSYTKQVAPTYDASKVGKLVSKNVNELTDSEKKAMAARSARDAEFEAVKKARADAKAAAAATVKVGGNSYYAKYLKYKQKYLTLKSQGF